MSYGARPCGTGPSALELNLRALRPLLPTPTSRSCASTGRARPSSRRARAGGARPLPFADFDWCRRLAKLVANSTRQRIDEESPLLSASLPRGERMQIVLPPATTPGCVAITIRRPSDQVWSIEELSASGIFRATRRASETLDATETELLRLLELRTTKPSCAWRSTSRKNIVVSGPTGSGKTT